jgi:hypothetical protein
LASISDLQQQILPHLRQQAGMGGILNANDADALGAKIGAISYKCQFNESIVLAPE